MGPGDLFDLSQSLSKNAGHGLLGVLFDDRLRHLVSILFDFIEHLIGSADYSTFVMAPRTLSQILIPDGFQTTDHVRTESPGHIAEPKIIPSLQLGSVFRWRFDGSKTAFPTSYHG